MPSRRALLRTGGLGLTAALGGCLFGGDSDDGDRTPATTTPVRTTTQLTAEPDEQPRLRAVERTAVPDDATAVLANERVRTLVSDAAATDGRVDYLPDEGPVDEDDRLVFDAFDRIRYRGETYNPTSSYAGFAEEATYQVDVIETAEAGTDDGVDSDAGIVVYADLTDAEREIADQLLAEGSSSAGGHEEIPDAFFTFRSADALRVDDTLYRLRTLVGDNIGHHMLTLRAADAAPDSTVVTVADRVLPADRREPVRTAVTAGSAELSDDEAEAFGSMLGEARFVCTAHAVVEFVPGDAG
jgi:hypothetical protein